MSSYIKSEIYRTLRKRGTYLFIGICSLLLASSNIVLAIVKQTDSSFRYATTLFSLGNLYTSMLLVYYICIMVAVMVFSNEHGNHTMKNTISYGIPRVKVYFGKFITEVMLAVVSFVIISGVHILTAYLLLENSGPEHLEMLLRTVFACLPLFLSALAVTNCFSFILESAGSAIGASCMIMIAIPLIFGLLGMRFDIFDNLSSILPTNLINEMEFDLTNNKLILGEVDNGYLKYWIYGIGQMLLFIIIGLINFRKKEVK